MQRIRQKRQGEKDLSIGKKKARMRETRPKKVADLEMRERETEKQKEQKTLSFHAFFDPQDPLGGKWSNPSSQPAQFGFPHFLYSDDRCYFKVGWAWLQGNVSNLSLIGIWSVGFASS